MARALGISAQKLNDYIHQRERPSRKTLLRFRNVDANLHWLLTHEGDMLARPGKERESRRIPVVGRAAANANAPMYFQEVDETPIDVPPGMHAVQAEGASMEPVILDGQWVLFTDDEPDDGDLAVVLTADDEVLFKRVYRRRGGWELTSTNPVVDPRYAKRGEIRRMWKVWGAKY